MKQATISLIALAAVTSISAIAWAGEGPKGHSHDESFSAGGPRGPQKTARPAPG
ncbi:MAG TPA: copper resistance protein, partial [Afipia sp.]|nr:copper resistance protein [Afipia sp.]